MDYLSAISGLLSFILVPDLDRILSFSLSISVLQHGTLSYGLVYDDDLVVALGLQVLSVYQGISTFHNLVDLLVCLLIKPIGLTYGDSRTQLSRHESWDDSSRWRDYLFL